MICKLAHQNMRQQAGTRSAPFNRLREGIGACDIASQRRQAQYAVG